MLKRNSAMFSYLINLPKKECYEQNRQLDDAVKTFFKRKTK